MSTTIAAVGERALIDRIQARVGPPPPHVEIGIGDDAATLAGEPGSVAVVTTDALVEGVHFRREWTAPRAIGHKALAVNLSDLAAMGAQPRASLLSLALPDDFPLADFDAFLDGFASLAASSGAALAGGNRARSPGPLIASVTAIGAARRRRVLRRCGARAGHELYMTGTIGGAAAGLARLAAGASREHMDAGMAAAVSRYEMPDARWRIGWMLGRSGTVAAAMDLSDGLAAAARDLAAASGLGVVLDAEAIPLDEAARAWGASSGQDALEFALGGGEDYELVLAVAPRLRSRFLATARRARGVPVTQIGKFVAEPGAWLIRANDREPLPVGFQHWGTEPFSTDPA